LQDSFRKSIFDAMPSKPPPAAQELPHRDLTDPRAMRALAHPRRLDLLQVLFAEGPLTASQCAQRLDDSPASCSYHLRQLAKWGFVEETGDGHGRERPWRYVPKGNRWGRPENAAQKAAMQLLTDVVDRRRFEQLRRHRATEDQLPAEWQEAARSDDFAFWATPEETARLGEQISALLVPFQQRAFDGDRPDGSLLTTWLIYGFPVRDA
jgi:DNA-binding transcriptional ArsR family regulator